MTDQLLTPNAVVSKLMRLSEQLAQLTDDLEAVEQEAVNRREDFTMAFEAAKLKAADADTVGERDAQAALATHDERLAANLAEALVRGRKRQIDSLKVRIDVGRSAAAALRAEITLGGVH